MGVVRIPSALLWRKRWGCLRGVSTLIVCMLAAQPVRGRDPGVSPPNDTGPPEKSASSRPRIALRPGVQPAPASAGDAEPWHPNLLRDRQIEVHLRTALRDISSGRLIGGLTELQAIIDREDDVFVRFESEPVPRGAHALAENSLGSLAPDALGAYETLFGKQARQYLEAALLLPDPQLLARVARRYYFTSAGFEAGSHLAAYWTDHGCDELAWGWWQRVLNEPAHRRRVLPMHRMRAAWCGRRLGRSAAVREILQATNHDQALTIAGRPFSVDLWLGQSPLEAGGDAAGGDCRVVGGQIDRNGAGVGSGPAVGRPLWSRLLAGEHSRHIETLARAWQDHQLQMGLPIGTAQFPLLVGEKLIFRDFEGLRAVSLKTGKSLWSYTCASALCREIAPRQTVAADGNPDPNNVMRHVVGNCTLGTLAGDAHHVFALDRIEAEEAAPPHAAAPNAEVLLSQRHSNVLAAFDLEGQAKEVQPVWSVGGREVDADRGRPLAGHFFLGPPLPVADRLYAVSEHNQQLFLSCLKSASGELLWTQAICSVTQPISADYQRFALVCSPSYGEGIVVCPTQSGVLVAVDGMSGALLWAASHDDSEPAQRQQMSAWPYSSRRRFGHPGYLNLPVIHNSHVVYLPAHSEYVHCLDLTSGAVRWRVRRDDLESSTATEFVAAVTDTTVVIVGHRKCRGLALDSGRQEWTVRLGSSPAGRGVRLGSSYHLALDDGRLVSLELDTGRTSAAPFTPGAARLGNLVAGADSIVSMGPGEIVVYPQARGLLDQLEPELTGGAPLPAKILEAAELELTLGRCDRAEQHLETVLARGNQSPEACRAAELLRGLLAGKLHRGDCPPAVLQRLARLSGDAERRGGYLLEVCRAGLFNGDAKSAVSAARDLAASNEDSAVAAADDPSRSAPPLVLAAKILRQFSRHDEKALRALESLLVPDVDRAVRDENTLSMRRLIRLMGDAPMADELRLQLAQVLARQGRLQQAETVLLACRGSRQPSAAGQATRLLAELWSRIGLVQDAAQLFGEIATRFAGVDIAPQRSGANWLAGRSRDDPAYEAFTHLSASAAPGADLRIVESGAADDRLQSVYNANGVQCLATPRQSPFELFDRGRGSNGVFTVVDRRTGLAYPETIHVKGRFFYPVSSQSCYMQHSFVGHFLPLGGVGAVHGISLLERKLLWSASPPGLSGAKEFARVGPAGPGFCTFQYRQHLYAVDPLDGRVLWQRDDLEAASGLMSEPFLGIIGDEDVLVVFASNGANYTVYETSSGAELRRGKLDIQPRMPRRAIGRRLFHYSMAPDARRLRVWDPESDTFVWDQPADEIAEASVLEGVPPGTKIATFVRETDEAAFVTLSGRVRVVDLVTGHERLDVPIDPQLLENLSFLRAFRDGERYYFNLQRTPPPGHSVSIPEYLVTDASLPCVHIQGELCAVDPKTQQVVWRRTLGSRSLVQLVGQPLPVLVSLCRIRRQDQASLAVEALDLRTGQTLAARDDLVSDRLLQASYDRQRGSIELRGGKTTIRLEFAPNVAGLSAGELSP